METAIISLICVALIAFGGMTMSRGFITSVDNSAKGIDNAGHRNETIMRTELTPLSADLPSGNTLQIILQNTGQTKLSDYDKWDVFVQYYDTDNNYHVIWLPYTDGVLGDNEWEISWIHLESGKPEVINPGVLDPKEEIMIKAQLNPAPGPGTTNLAVVATPNGVSASIYFLP